MKVKPFTTKKIHFHDSIVCLFVWFLNVLVNNYAISQTGPKTERLTILRAATHETELGDHDFCLSRSHYTDTDPTSRERAHDINGKKSFLIAIVRLLILCGGGGSNFLFFSFKYSFHINNVQTIT